MIQTGICSDKGASCDSQTCIFCQMDKDEKDLLERIEKLKIELAELQTSASSASQLSTSAESTAQTHPASSPAQVLGDTLVDAAVFEMDPTKNSHATLDFKMRLSK